MNKSTVPRLLGIWVAIMAAGIAIAKYLSDLTVMSDDVVSNLIRNSALLVVGWCSEANRAAQNASDYTQLIEFWLGYCAITFAMAYGITVLINKSSATAPENKQELTKPGDSTGTEE